MNKKSVLVLWLGLLWLGGGKVEEKQEKIEPPDWYRFSLATL
jgi:hypothetical protein